MRKIVYHLGFLVPFVRKTDVKVYDDTVLLNFPLYCPKCKNKTLINVVQLKNVRCE